MVYLNKHTELAVRRRSLDIEGGDRMIIWNWVSGIAGELRCGNSCSRSLGIVRSPLGKNVVAGYESQVGAGAVLV